ncbi:MAG: D-tyrosyl-tRNA(Tyr) deacylase [Clostridia bacterium]|nr:D-tyrosyl-tRNA(Tyr) deacylase [Clostridia bacterium]
MKAVVQRVLRADLKVDGQLVSEIGKGYVIFLGVGKGDTEKDGDYFIKKIPSLRICEDENGKINKNILDDGGEILLVSQFTLFADTSHGNRPSFIEAEIPEKANQLYEYVVDGIAKTGITVKKGVFGADMKINQVNDGPFTVIMESPKK